MLILKEYPQLLETKKMTPKTITEKTNLHPRNQHRFRYDFELLIKNSPIKVACVYKRTQY
jgi:hypothetical protein